MRNRWLWAIAPITAGAAVVATSALRPPVATPAVPAGCAKEVILFCADPSWPDPRPQPAAADTPVPGAGAPRLHALPD